MPTLREKRREAIVKQIAKLQNLQEGILETLVRVRTKLPQLERQLRRYDKPAAGKAPPKPAVTQVESPKDDLAIPGFLQRTPSYAEAQQVAKMMSKDRAAEKQAAESAAVAKETAERKAAKTKARIGKMKALKAERDARNAIPASKRFWDMNKSRWVAI